MLFSWVAGRKCGKGASALFLNKCHPAAINISATRADAIKDKNFTVFFQPFPYFY
jgi:hypothetical protein